MKRSKRIGDYLTRIHTNTSRCGRIHCGLSATCTCKRMTWKKTGAAAEEAEKVFKRLAAVSPAQYGDDLVSCYYLESESLNAIDSSRACKLIGLASEAA